MKKLLLFAALAALSFGQQTIRFAATTGDMTLSAARTTTLQQLASNQSQILIDQIIVYCSVDCSITQAANGAAATSTAGTITPILPTQLALTVPATFWTTSNVGSGTAQGGALHVPAGATAILCLSPMCGAPAQVTLGTGGTGANYSLTIGNISGTANVTFYGRTQ